MRLRTVLRVPAGILILPMQQASIFTKQLSMGQCHLLPLKTSRKGASLQQDHIQLEKTPAPQNLPIAPKTLLTSLVPHVQPSPQRRMLYCLCNMCAIAKTQPVLQNRSLQGRKPHNSLYLTCRQAARKRNQGRER